ncbi:MAG: hypothetical protein ABSB40_10980 [Nitrososphaeria archaeon]|jgi:hypothetical protein
MSSKDNDVDTNGLEDILRELKELGRRKPLSKLDLIRAKKLMKTLRELGYTNMEISNLTDGGWREPTVKIYTRGTTVKDSSQKRNIMQLLLQLVDMNLTLEDVKALISIKSSLDSKGTSLEAVTDLLKATEAAKASIGELIKTNNSLTLSKITVDQLKQILEYKKRYELMGLAPDHLKNMYTLLEKYGKYEFVIQAINTYNSLAELQRNLKVYDSKKIKLEIEINSLTKEISGLNQKRKEIEEPLKKYDNLKGKGLDEAALQELSKAREKFGSIGGVIRAVNSFGSLVDISSRISEKERNEKDLENRANKLRTENAQMIKAVEMCRKLDLTYGFNLDTIESLIAIAEEYGSPKEVIEAIKSYGSLKAIVDKVNVLENIIRKYEANIAQLKGDTYSLEKKRDTAISEGREYSSRLQALKTEAERFGEEFGEEVEEAKIILALRTYPSELKIENLDYLVQIIRSLASKAKNLGLNKKFVLKDVMDATVYSKRPYPSAFSEVELLEVLDWACRAITACVVKASLDKAGAS